MLIHSMNKLIFLLLISFFVSAQTLNVKNISAVEMDVELIFEVENTANVHLPYAYFNTSVFYNQSDHQKVLNLSSNAQIVEISDALDGNQRIVFNFSLSPNEKKNITMYGKIFVNYSLNITQNAPYPFNYPEELSIYTKESDYVKISSEIKTKAEELRGNSNDTYEIIANVVNWIYQNIKYDKAYVDPTMDSEFVMREKKGVCDEFSHLTIAMLRHLNIPSRIIVGYVHSGEFWGPHAWTEVWIPNYGWIEVDSTFSELGWLDGTHLRISHGIDQKQVTDSFSTTAPFDLKNLRLYRNQNYVFKRTDAFEPPVTAELIVPVSPVEQGQLINVTAKISNPTNNHLFLPVRLKPSQELILFNPSLQLLHIPPNTNITHDWSIQFPNMSMQLIYRYPVVLEIGNIYQRQVITGKKILNEEDYPRFVLVQGYGIVPVGDAAKVSIVLVGNHSDGVYGTIELIIEEWRTMINYSLANGETMTYDISLPEYLLKKSTKGTLNITYGDYYINLPLPINVVGDESATPDPGAPTDLTSIYLQTIFPVFIILMIVISGVIIFLAKQKRIS